MKHSTTNTVARCLVLALAAILLCLAVSGCTSPAVGSVAAIPEAGTFAPPTVLGRFDGNAFVGWAQTTAQVEVFDKDTGGPIYGPLEIPGGKVVAYRIKDKLKFESNWPGALPEWTRPLFRPSEIASWGLEFQP